MPKKRLEQEASQQDLWSNHSGIVQTYLQQHDVAKALAERGRPDLITSAFDQLEPLERSLLQASAHMSRAKTLWYQRQNYPDNSNIHRRLGNESGDSYRRACDLLNDSLNTQDIGAGGDGDTAMDKYMYIEQLPAILQTVLALMSQGAVGTLDRYLSFIPGMPPDDVLNLQLETRNSRQLSLNGIRHGSPDRVGAEVGKSKLSPQRELATGLQNALDESYSIVVPLKRSGSS